MGRPGRRTASKGAPGRPPFDQALELVQEMRPAATWGHIFQECRRRGIPAPEEHNFKRSMQRALKREREGKMSWVMTLFCHPDPAVRLGIAKEDPAMADMLEQLQTLKPADIQPRLDRLAQEEALLKLLLRSSRKLLDL